MAGANRIVPEGFWGCVTSSQPAAISSGRILPVSSLKDP